MKNLFSFPKQPEPLDFDGLIRPHLDGLYRLAFRFCQHQHDAEDLVQDLVTKMYLRRDELADKENLRAWLNTSLYHLFIDGTRKSNRSPLQLVEDEVMLYETTPCHELGPEQKMDQSQLKGQLACALSQLSDEHRSVLVLHDVEGYRLTELQDMLGVPIGTLKSRVHRARARLRDLVQVSSLDDQVPSEDGSKLDISAIREPFNVYKR